MLTNIYKICTINITNANPLRYRGYYLGSETGYYYLQSRYYDPSICRFINADIPEYILAEKNNFSGICSFAYCMNNPTNNSDPYGYSAKKDFKTPKEALKKWANDHFKKSKNMNKEICALLYSYIKNHTYYYGYTEYAIGKKTECDPVKQCKYYSRPQNTRVVGTIHTHPNATVGGFSKSDYEYNKIQRLNGYVVCKQGVYAHLYTSKSGNITRMLNYRLGRFV